MKSNASRRHSEVKRLYASSEANRKLSKPQNTTNIRPKRFATNECSPVFRSLLAALGIGIGWIVFSKRPAPENAEDSRRKMAYRRALQRLYRRPAHKSFARRIVERLRSRLYRRHRQRHRAFCAELGRYCPRIQVGFVRSYAAFILFGALIVDRIFYLLRV